MTLAELIEAKRAEIDQHKKTYDAALARQRGITTKARDEGRDQLTKLEAEEIATLRAEATDAERRYDVGKRALDELERAAAEDQRSAEQGEATQEKAPTLIPEQRDGRGKSAYDQVARVGQEARTYSKESDKAGRQFLRDVASQFLNRSDFGAVERLARHMREEEVERGAEKLAMQQRATGTGAFSGLVVPQYLTDMYAPAVAALRPFADASGNGHDLPESGMTVNISRITTASSVDNQSAENAAVSETDMDDTLLTINVQTAAGQQTISRQAVERGTGVEEVTVQDLFKRYATNLDSKLITQATTGLSAVATAVAYTDASPTGAELYPKLLAAAAGSEAALLGMASPDIAVMHSRRWYWLQSQLTSTWPLFQQGSLPAQSAGHVDPFTRYGSGFRGVLPSGLNVIVDNNIATNSGAGTNEDEIYVVPSEECHLWEDPAAPMFIRADQPKLANLGVLLVVYGYYAYTFGRYPAGMQKVAGTGLTTPAFS